MLLEYFANVFLEVIRLPSVLEQLSGLLIEFYLYQNFLKEAPAYLTTSDSINGVHRVCENFVKNNRFVFNRLFCTFFYQNLPHEKTDEQSYR